ncbi:MAG: hypothetical protein LKJ59_05470 [Oscillospiraceae bacterium]|jgi:bifunctional pyridoxal-dependent enzyme with beta-cystathionase and maltose regulon repressor activities|nr:hypothetical protein [Oscillospiraceae bacterium]MCI2035159.1 hypothetical protein [Oscillospiraceae bacterium]
MNVSFDPVIDRKRTNSLKYDFAAEHGKPADVLPFWVADMDFRCLGLDGDRLEDLIVNRAKLWFDAGPLFGPEGEGFERINIPCPRSLLSEALFQLKQSISQYEAEANAAKTNLVRCFD